VKFRYLGGCAAGFVQFARANEPAVVLPEGESVDVPEWLAVKLKTNNHFELVPDDAVLVEIGRADGVVDQNVMLPKRRGRKPKVTSDAGSH